MRKITLFLLFLLTFTTIFSQKRINWAEDPVNLKYDGTPGMTTVKLLYSAKVSTQGRSGKWTTGMSGKGIIVDIDSKVFSNPGSKIFSGIVFACANPTEFPDGLDRSRIQIVTKTIVNGNPQFVQCDSLQSIAKNLNLLINDIENLSEDVWQINKKVTNIEEILNENGKSTFSFWNSPLPYIAGIILVAIIVDIIIDLNEKDNDYAATETKTGTGPGGNTGPIWKKIARLALAIRL